jgi:hypothetical protein
MMQLFFYKTVQSDLRNKYNPSNNGLIQFFKETLAYLTFSSANVRDKLTTTTLIDFEKSLDTLLEPDATPYREVLETAFRIVSCPQLKNLYETPDPNKLAKTEAVYLTLPSSSPEQTSPSINNYAYTYGFLAASFLVFLTKIPAIFTTSLFQMVLYVMRERPKIYAGLFDSYVNGKPQGERIFEHLIGNSLTSLKSVGSFTYSKLEWAWECYKDYFGSSPLSRLFFGSIPLLYLLYYTQVLPRLTLDAPQTLAAGKSFQNLNELVRLGKIRPGQERIVEKELLSNALIAPPGLDVNIVFITGDSGVGKTHLIKDLALTCVYDTASPHYEKTVFYINAADLGGQELSYMITSLLELIKGIEDKVIVCFDEAHNTTKRTGGTGLIELCKTHFIDNNISCIMATTTTEYKDQIAPNYAFVSRTEPIELTPLPDEMTKDILREKVMNIGLDMTLKAYDTIIAIGKSHPTYQSRFNPRKSLQILKQVVTKALKWSPTTLALELQTKKAEIRKLQIECQNNTKADVHWSKSPEGIIKSTALTTAENQEANIRKKLDTQKGKYGEIKSILKLLSTYEIEWIKTAHKLASQPNHQTEKRFLYTKFVAVPAIKRLLDKKLADFEKVVGQKLSVKIDENFVSAQFK